MKNARSASPVHDGHSGSAEDDSNCVPQSRQRYSLIITYVSECLLSVRVIYLQFYVVNSWEALQMHAVIHTQSVAQVDCGKPPHDDNGLAVENGCRKAIPPPHAEVAASSFDGAVLFPWPVDQLASGDNQG